MPIKSFLKQPFLVQQTFYQIQHRIIDGLLLPTQNFSLTDLSQKLMIEPYLIKEALSCLVDSGLIVADRDDFFSVVEITESRIRDLYQTLLQVDEIAITQSVAHANYAWGQALKKRLQEFDAVINQPGEHLVDIIAERGYHFHAALVANCESPALIKIHADLYHQYHIFVKFFIKDISHKKDMIRLQKEHRKIAQAALAGDAKAACALNYHHIIGTLKSVVDGFNKINTLQKKSRDRRP